MRKYFVGLVETLAQRIVRMAILRAAEILDECAPSVTPLVEIERAKLPEIEFLQ